MSEVLAYFEERLRGVSRLAVLGVGSTLRADDAAGMRILEHLQENCPREKFPGLLLCPGETAPENYCGKIRDFGASHLIVVDAADVGREPGEIVEIRPEDVGGPSFCTHMLPLKVMLQYLAEETGMQVTLLGIQYQSIAFDGPMTAPVQAAVRELSQGLETIIASALRCSF